MRKTKRGLEMADVAAILERSSEAGDAREVYREVERISQECVGWRLLTILRYVEADAAVERLYSSDEQAYPVGGRKPSTRSPPAMRPWRKATSSWRRHGRRCARPFSTMS
jgi:hypothetical protein